MRRTKQRRRLARSITPHRTACKPRRRLFWRLSRGQCGPQKRGVLSAAQMHSRAPTRHAGAPTLQVTSRPWRGGGPRREARGQRWLRGPARLAAKRWDWRQRGPSEVREMRGYFRPTSVLARSDCVPRLLYILRQRTTRVLSLTCRVWRGAHLNVAVATQKSGGSPRPQDISHHRRGAHG
jgi:hypothetical protein